MAEIHALRSHAQIQREASHWLARLNADQVSEADRAGFEGWRNASSHHARVFDEVSATWAQLNRTGTLVSSVSLGQALGASTQLAIRRSLRKSRLRMGFAAAAVLSTVAVATWWWSDTTPRTLFQTAIGEHATIELPDGSSLELNSNSRARVEYSTEARVVRLERGEAYFDVERDAHRPFSVLAGGSWVRAIGTAFNVYVRPSGVRVTVSEGAVKVAANAAELANASVAVLKAGQQVEVRGAATEIRSLAIPELTHSVSWRRGTVYFKEEPLKGVVGELSRYTTLEIVIGDDGLRNLEIAGTFETNPQGAEALLTTLEEGFGLEVRRDGRRAYISRPTQIK